VTRLAGALPKDSAHNGLAAIEQKLIDNPEDEYALVVRVTTSKLTTSIESGEVEATLKIIAIEPILDVDVDIADRIMRAARAAHTSQMELPIDGLRVVPGTGEVIDSPFEADARLRAAGDHTLDDDFDAFDEGEDD